MSKILLPCKAGRHTLAKPKQHKEEASDLVLFDKQFAELISTEQLC